MSDLFRADAINAYAEHVKTLTDKYGNPYTANERTLLVIGYAQGWDAARADTAEQIAVAAEADLERMPPSSHAFRYGAEHVIALVRREFGQHAEEVGGDATPQA